MLTEEIKKHLAVWFRHNYSENKRNLKDFITERVCRYAKEKRPAEQIVGMLTILDDLLRLEDEYLK